MLEVGGDLHFAEETLGAEGGGQVGPEDLDCDLAVVFEVLGQVDRGHPARAEFPLDPVSASEGRCESVLRIGHGGPGVGETTVRLFKITAGGRE